MKKNQESLNKEALNKKAMEMAERELNKIEYNDEFPLVIDEGSKIKRIYIVENLGENEVVSDEDEIEVRRYNMIDADEESNEYLKGDFEEDDLVEDSDEYAPYIENVRHEVAIEFVCDESTPKSSGAYVPYRINIVTDASLEVIESKLLECDTEDDILYIDFDD